MNKNRIIDEFCRLVEIDAPSYGERRMADCLKEYLSELGFIVEEDRAGKDYHGDSGNVYGFLKGELEGEPLLFSAHMDTVEPSRNKKAVVHPDGTITSDGTTILGADDISGIVAILEAIRTIKEEQIPHRSIEVIFPIAEEVYLRGSEVFDFKKIKAKEAYVLDLSGPVGTAALSAPTLISFTATFHGKAAHAGFAPEKGIHAIAVAAEAITKIKQGRVEHLATVNVGTIDGGLARNIVPECCSVEGEVRSMDHNQALKIVHEIHQVCLETANRYGAGCDFVSSFGCIAYEVDKTAAVVKNFDAVCSELGIRTHYISTFGGSDNNNFIRNGIHGIVIACGMNNVHTTEEYTHIDELMKCSEIVKGLMTRKGTD